MADQDHTDEIVPDGAQYEYRSGSRGFSMTELRTALTALFEVPQPAHPLCTHSAWYCGNEDCSVRHVTIRAQHPPGAPQLPDTLQCPACKQPLGFQTHLASVTLRRTGVVPTLPALG